MQKELLTETKDAQTELPPSGETAIAVSDCAGSAAATDEKNAAKNASALSGDEGAEVSVLCDGEGAEASVLCDGEGTEASVLCDGEGTEASVLCDGEGAEAPPAEAASAEKAESRRAEEQSGDFEEMAAFDLAELQKSFPETRTLSHLSGLSNARRFGELRETGYSARMAYLLSRDLGGEVRRSTDSGKEHLSSLVSKRGSFSLPDAMTYTELSAAKELFSELSPQELLSLYKRAKRV